ncbi:DUF969 domain-containing protein [Novosphingobium album (ex Hu et al. 2023)]|uniref:DUF969 domain-containing protein n=1 Tax=Novosphingobium album (ex Hu et al. 2023) TaxID=2930093 RepID=A0ABT0B1W8_9SPHN|nr:DUF969 domain-containing protein [Novosphingobium album (ex Hu et al. 2023)]MCJ2179066.1 DUF969 domain-containing protein [Novosphingobium album (ex Hu et al. 2023)]
MWVLAGIVVIAAGFMLRFNPLLVVVASALVTGLAAGLDPGTVLSAFGKAFNDNRYITIIYIVLPVIGILERHGLQERARDLIGRIRGATLGRLLLVYLLFRQVTAALGLTSIAGPAQTVRPLIAPMAEAAAETQAPGESDPEQAKALAAATDNVGLFFGEDIFIAIGSILLMKGVLEADGIDLPPLALSAWAIPTAIAAFAIHGTRLLLADRQLRRKARKP